MRMYVRLGLFLAVSLLPVPRHLSAQESGRVELPDTRAARLLADYLELCRSPDLERLTTWNAEHTAPEILDRFDAASLARDDVSQCTRHGGFDTGQVLESAPHDVELLARSRAVDTWMSLRLVVNDDGRIVGRGVRPHEPPESALPDVPDEAALARLVQAHTAEMAEAGLFSGIVVVARGSEPIVTASAGFADREAESPITGSTQFTLGSMGKLFTAVAVGQLVDQGRIAFNDTVGRFFPDYANETVRRRVTVGMLLAHTAGMDDFLARRTPEMMTEGVERATEFMPLYENDEPRFEPGTSWAYSNAGLALAGAIVEQVTGQSYPAYLREHVFAVAGMTDSDPNNIPHISPDLVTPYTRWGSEDGSWQVAGRDIGSPAGGAISTANDLVRFADALRSGRLVRREILAEMIQPRGIDQYGYAMEIHDVYGRTVVGHGGGFPGVSTNLSLVLDSPYTVVVLANQDPPAEEYVRRYAAPLAVKLAQDHD